MLRLTLAARIGLIVTISLLALWMVGLALYYRSQSEQGEALWPSPDQIAAIATLAERSTGPDLADLLTAVNSPHLAVTLLDKPLAAALPEAPASDSEPWAPGQRLLAMREAHVVERARQSYGEALGGRQVIVTRPAPTFVNRTFPTRSLRPENAERLFIGLRTGKTMMVDIRNAMIVTPFGLPVGLGAGIFGTLVALGALLVMQRETRPLARLAAAVDRVDLTTEPVPLPSPRRSAPEIRAVINAFDRLQTRLSTVLRARMAMVGGISHDVRSFATRLRLRVERIEDEKERALAVGDIEDMIRLLDDALLASRSGAGELRQEMVAFSEIIAAELADRRAAGAPVTYVAGPLNDDMLLGDRLALRRILANLIDNALKYGHAAHLALGAAEDWLTLTVDDEGPGIPADKRAAILEPFSRLESSRSRSTGGAGLGLAVVRSLVEAHGGELAISDAPGGGARLTVTLPTFTLQHGQ